ncbi:SMF family protein [Marinomonas ushuaiensis DSM 15871]|uniref:SMF family protein n=1 Tax=Marinomonas ushuaiensis DSM 15871 TaxID=1122207 RepID=X7E0U0_9GAMM|nr:DNA-processing protein DprA [Marinomonas ushuaiensis]ETX09699.1 SMF family protein [Marinomonas ushuaiensis DSM 15871]
MNTFTDHNPNEGKVLQAILLLCSYFNSNEVKNVKPLSPTEYSRLALWLHRNKYTPADFLTKKEEILSEWVDPRSDFKNPISAERLNDLLGRAASMGFALEKWQQQNVHIISRASRQYPKVIKDQFEDTRPPILYCIGNKELLNNKGVGFVGSRKIDKDDEEATKGYVSDAVSQGYMIVSGAAKGVDETAMITALENGGTAIGIVAESLLKIATNKHYRQAIQEGRLLLISTTYPEARFSAGLAMGRNKYIYVLSEGVIVIKSGTDGGTWTGANENLKKQWVPLLVRDIDEEGNQQLIQKGGIAISPNDINVEEIIHNSLLKTPTISESDSKQAEPMIQDMFTTDLFSSSEESESQQKPETRKEVALPLVEQAVKKEAQKEAVKPAPQQQQPIEKDSESHIEQVQLTEETTVQTAELGLFLDAFYQQLLASPSDTTFTPKMLATAHPELTESIIKQWLNTLDEQGLVKRQGRKLAYKRIKKDSQI